ncbi:MAG: ABC transporter ATP-binding protein [Clostridiales bacterium]|nr:ABC transporter ATP-binding protein [Clostridiales bacterium]
MVFGKHINKYYLKYIVYIIFGLLALTIVDGFELVIPEKYRMVINGMNQGYVMYKGVETPFDFDFLLTKICMPLVGIILAMIVGRFLWRVCFFGLAVKVEFDLRNRMFDHARKLSQEYYQVNKVGNMMSLFTNDLDAVQESFGWGIMMFFDAAFLGILAVIKMWRMNVLLTILSLIPMAFLMGASTIVGGYMSKKWDLRQEAFSRLSDFSQESFSGIAVIKAFVKETLELMAFKKLNVENEKANVDYTRSAVLLRILVTLFVESVICVILGYGGYLVYKGAFNAGQMIEFISYFMSIVWPVMAVSELIDMSSRGGASLKRISELLDAKPEVVDRENAENIGAVRGDIEFRNLTFTYPDGERPVLENVSFAIASGESVGLVGKTGSGKTTLVDLILRIYNVPDGSLFIDGHDVNTVTIAGVRNACAYVPQDNFLFSDTIENNIGFGMDHPDHSEVEHAAVMADVDENIRQFKFGYETILGERGVTVSGGQKQRISIARALMMDAPILILDDSVSAVDTKTERNILRNLRETRAGKTTILIAHRISTIEQMDKIVFIEDGRVSGVGTHESLYASNVEYRRMVDLQQLEEEGGEHTNA